MARDADPKREAILSAAFTQFSRYGFRRTSMEDIAEETEVSRASLYSYFENKGEIFRCLSASLHEETLGNAESHLKGVSDRSGGQTPLVSRVEAALLARFGPFLEVLTQSAHGGEIYDENSRLCGDLAMKSSERFRGLLANAIKSAAREGEIDLKTAGLTAPATAELIHLCAAGLKQGAPDVAAFEKRLHGYVKVFFAGLR